ncbi:MAG: flippase-like domain-containing protein, partial [Nannocystaceae bacterium]|nr:flippase-like domain-containing protein [Nannocystaceae bacterium]
MTSDSTPSAKRRLGSWAASLVFGGLLLWLASTQLQLWPDRLVLPRPGFVWLALALHVPYATVRALRLAYLLDPVVADASGDPRRRMSRAVVYGSGFLSFLVLLVLPLKLGELSRPLLVVGGKQPGVKLTESLAAVATERIIDGLLICTMLFGGLALAESNAPGVDESLGSVHRIGLGMLALFVVALIGLLIAARFPQRAAETVTRFGGKLGPRAARILLRLTAPVSALFDPRRVVPLLATSFLYWGITVAQLWLVLGGCGVTLGLAEAAAIVAIIGLSIQLPGGPGQTGTFQIGAAAALGLFLTDAQVAGPGSSFAVVMYLLQFVGAGLMAIPGAWLVARAARAAE